MPDNDDKRDLPIDPSEWEATELWKGDDEEIAQAVHDAKTEIFDEDAPQQPDPTGQLLRRRRGWLWWLALAALLGAGAFVALDPLGRGEREPGPAAALQDAAPSRPAPDAAPAAPPRAEDAAPPDATAAPIPADYTAAFRRHQAAVSRCLTEHGSDAAGLDRIELRFELSTDGTVASASVNPPAIATTDLGTCLHAVATAARFAPQTEPVRIRIPIALRRR